MDEDERNHTLWPDCSMCLSLCSLSTYRSEYHKQRINSWPTGVNTTAYLNVFLRDLHSAVRYDNRLAYDMAGTLSECASWPLGLMASGPQGLWASWPLGLMASCRRYGRQGHI